MKCHDINLLLDTCSREKLTRAQRETIDGHLATCHACGEDWSNLREVAALPVPAMSVGLRGRIAAALPVRVVVRHRAFRPLLVGGLLLGGAALAVAIALQSARRDPEPLPAVAEATAAPAIPPPAAALQETAMPAAPASASTAVAVAAADGLLDPRSIVVLARPEAAADAPAIAKMMRCQDALIRQLRTVGGLNVIAGAAVSAQEAGRPTRLGATLAARHAMQKSDGEIARALGAGTVLIVSTDNGCAATQFNSQTGATIAGLMYGGDPLQEDWDAFGARLAGLLRDKTVNDAASESTDPRSTLLNAALTDKERVDVLWKLGSFSPGGANDPPRRFIDKDILMTAIQLGTKSADAQVRESVWAALRSVNDPSLVQPLLQALAGDPEASVRVQAALSLNTFLDRPGVREALQRAVAEDPAREPKYVCCVLTVREAAQRSLVADKDFRGWVRSTLLDESLPARSRLLSLQNTTPDRRFMTLSIADYGREEARVAFDIGRREQDPQVRAMAWTTLSRAAPDESFFPVLLGDMASHPDDGVRVAAARVLEKSAGKPEVHAAFERALDDPSIAVRRVAASAIAGSGK